MPKIYNVILHAIVLNDTYILCLMLSMYQQISHIMKQKCVNLNVISINFFSYKIIRNLKIAIEILLIKNYNFYTNSKKNYVHLQIQCF